MMYTDVQLKSHVRNMAKSTGVEPQSLYTNYMVERFLKRMSLSKYKQHFILKGGVLIAYTIGFSARGTMDLDGTISGYPVTVDALRTMMEEIIATDGGDSVEFEVGAIQAIREEADYGGLRISLVAYLRNLKIPFKLDASTGDAITPRPVEFTHELMFTGETIELLAYNIETVLSEKYEAIISRGVQNTRMRDFYDVYMLTETQSYDKEIFKDALTRTAETRHSLKSIENAKSIIAEIESDMNMQALWITYQGKFGYARGVEWDRVIRAVRELSGNTV